jgi:basic membrane lipoprotein Med (substrate-binding protein (PBP1-ABC) superfamily)
MKKRTSRSLALCATLALALLSAGCHQPTFEQMQPTKNKWSLAVLAPADNDEQKAQLQSNIDKLARERAISARIFWVKPDQAAAALAELTKKKVDLVLLDLNVPNLGDLAKANPQTRFAVLDEGAQLSTNVRQLQLDPQQLLFLSGFLAAEANKQSSEPFTVLVDKARTASDEDWKMVLAGVHYAGRKDVPIQIVASELSASDATNGSNANAARQTVTRQLPKLSGRSILLLGTNADGISDAAWARIKAKGMVMVRSDQTDRPFPQAANVVAKPSSGLEAALGEEADLLAAGKWQGDQTANVKQKRQFDLLQPDLFADKNLQIRLEQLEELLASNRLDPQRFVADVSGNQ